MRLFRLDPAQKKLTPLQLTTLAHQGFTEPADLESWIANIKADLFSRNILWIARQDFVTSEQRSDLIGIAQSGAVIVCELKRGTVQEAALLQALGYAAEYQHYDLETLSKLFLDNVQKNHIAEPCPKSLEEARAVINQHLAGGDLGKDVKINEEQIILLVGEEFSPNALSISDYLNFGSDNALFECWRYTLFKSEDAAFHLSVEQILPPPSVRIAIETRREESRSRKYARDPVRVNFMTALLAAVRSTPDCVAWRSSGASYYCNVATKSNDEKPFVLDIYGDTPRLSAPPEFDPGRIPEEFKNSFKVQDGKVTIYFEAYRSSDITFSGEFMGKLLTIVRSS